MKEYLPVVVSIILGLFIPIFWNLIKNHFKIRQNEKDLDVHKKDTKKEFSRVNAELATFKEDLSNMKVDIAVIKESTNTIKEQSSKIVDLFNQHIVNKK